MYVLKISKSFSVNNVLVTNNFKIRYHYEMNLSIFLKLWILGIIMIVHKLFL
jgi:hypothetical protein